jgi:hypothetical protein
MVAGAARVAGRGLAAVEAVVVTPAAVEVVVAEETEAPVAGEAEVGAVLQTRKCRPAYPICLHVCWPDYLPWTERLPLPAVVGRVPQAAQHYRGPQHPVQAARKLVASRLTNCSPDC